jgi:glutathione transport system substrate-binding protein
MPRTARTLFFSVLLALAVGFVSAQSTVTIAKKLGINSLNPALGTGLADATVNRTMFEGLIGFDKDFNIVPELATSWKVNQDATALTFHLRQGVTFQDGTPFNAQAVKDYYSWVLGPKNAGSTARGYLSDIASIDVVGPYEVRFNLEKSNAAMLSNLATWHARIASPTSIKKYGDKVGQHPVGTGPFKFVSWKRGQSIMVEAYNHYWGKPAQIDRIQFLIVPNDSTRVAMLKSGEAQFIESVPPQLADTLEGNPNIKVSSTESVFLRILELNTQHPPFNDVRVRQALNYAINKQQFARVVYGGHATVMTAPMAEPVFGYAKQQPYSYNPERAKKLLAEAGYPDGFSFKVLTFNGTEYRTAGQVLQQMLAAVGVKMILNPTEHGALVEQIFKPFDENPTEASLVGASAITGDADRALSITFSRKEWPPQGDDWSFYNNPKVNTLLKKGRETGDPQKRAEIYAQAQKIIWNDAPWVFLVSPDNISAQATDLSGVFYMPDQTVDARKANLK